MKFECSKCGQRIEARTLYAGQQTNCPTCHEPITIPDADALAKPRVVLQPPQPPKAPSPPSPPPTPPGIDLPEVNVAISVDQIRTWIENDSARRYAVFDELNHGGIGEVLNAVDANLRRPVALKRLLDPSKATLEAVVRFIEEAQVTGQLQHPSIVPVHELGLDDSGQVFYTMKRISGSTLCEVLDGFLSSDPIVLERWPLPKLLRAFQRVCDAISFAHSRGVIHRDLKPDNIMLGEFGEVIVLDWGLAKIKGRPDRFPTLGGGIPGGGRPKGQWAAVVSARSLEGNRLMTIPGSVMGTPMYMSPEQVVSCELADERCDIFALGAILYEILSLSAPYRGNTVEEVLAKAAQAERESLEVVEQDFIRRKKKWPHLPGGRMPLPLAAVAMKAIARNPKDRYQSVSGMQTEIDAYLNGFATEAEHAGLGRLLWLFLSRHKAAALFTAALLTVLTAGLIINIRERRIAESERTRAEGATRLAESRAEAIRRNLYVAEMNFAAEATGRPDGLETVAKLTGKWLPETGMADLRGWEWYYLQSLLDQDVVATLSHGPGGPVRSVAYSPDGSLFASAGSDHFVRIWDAVTRTERGVLKGHTATIQSISWSPAGDQIATAGRFDKSLRIWNAKDNLVALVIPAGHTVENVSWSPDGKRIAACLVLASSPRQVCCRVWDTATGEEIETIPSDPAVSQSNMRINWRPRHSEWAVSQHLMVTIVRPGAPSRISSPPLITQGFRSWSPDGKWFSAAGNVQIQIWDPEKRQEVQRMPGHSSGIRSIAWSPDSNRLASASNDATIRLWERSSGKLFGILRGHRGDVTSVSWHPNGLELASTSVDGTIKIWNLRPHLEVPSFHWRTPYSMAVIWHPDGNRVAVATTVPGAAVTVWDADQKRRILELKLPTRNNPPACTWSPDGTRLAAVDCDHTLWIWDATTGAVLQSRPMPSPLETGYQPRISWQPGGRFIAGGGLSKDVWVWDPDSSDEPKLIDLKGSALIGLAWSPSGARLIASTTHREIAWDVESGHQTDFPGHNFSYFGWSPDGSKLVTSVNSGDVQVVSSADGTPLLKLQGHNQPVTALAWSPDRKRIATGGNDHTVRIWNASTGIQLAILYGHDQGVQTLSWGSDGRRLISGGGDRMILWDASKAYAAEADRAPSSSVSPKPAK